MHCYHCCHLIPNCEYSLGLPYSYKNDNFYTEYSFCSWSCMKSYNQYTNDSLKNYRYSLISLMWKYLHPDQKFEIISAPAKDSLKIFGGNMSIEEFRSVTTKITKPPYHLISQIKTYDNSANFTWNTSEDANNMYDKFKVDTVADEPLKLQRKSTKKTNQNTLENTMGIFTSSKP